MWELGGTGEVLYNNQKAVKNRQKQGELGQSLQLLDVCSLREGMG